MIYGHTNNKLIFQISGRIHSAIVSGVNLETRSVTVEWYERGETKGKEVEIDAILSLNPDLAPRHHTAHLQAMPNKLARVCAYCFAEFCTPGHTTLIQSLKEQHSVCVNNAVWLSFDKAKWSIGLNVHS